MRYKKALISLELLIDMAKQTRSSAFIVTENPLPDDARVVGFARKVEGNAAMQPVTLEIIVESDTFDDLPEPIDIRSLPFLPRTMFRRVEEPEPHDLP